jgi:alkanesulfonate monooxygenase SsuD/methylene tetrahydromethanopterin reductase-like flavin-dependent oxidoreductase (luciferase family)
MVNLAMLAALSTRPRIGTAVLLLPLFPPVLAAKQVAEIDRLSGGRVALGIGVGGEYPVEFDAVGVPIAERGRRTDEALPLLRRLFSGEAVDADGPFFPLHGVRLDPPPRPDIPILVAGRKPPAMRRAALLGDGWMPYLYSVEQYVESVATIRSTAANANRDLAGFEWLLFTFVAVADDPDEAHRQLAETLGSVFSRDMRGLADRVAAAGRPEHVAAHLQAYLDAGARELVLSPCGADIGTAVRTARRVVDEVLPLLQLRSTELTHAAR